MSKKIDVFKILKSKPNVWSKSHIKAFCPFCNKNITLIVTRDENIGIDDYKYTAIDPDEITEGHLDYVGGGKHRWQSHKCLEDFNPL